MDFQPTGAAALSVNVSEEEWHARLHTVCFRHFSDYRHIRSSADNTSDPPDAADFQHIQLYWGCLTRLFTHFLNFKKLPVPEWTTINPRLPAWATILFESNNDRLITSVERHYMGGADLNTAKFMDILYNNTFAAYFDAAETEGDSHHHDEEDGENEHNHHQCTHDLELEFLNYILLTPLTTSTTISYEDSAMTSTEILFNSMHRQATSILKYRKLAEDARICPPPSLTIDPNTGVRHLVIGWKVLHAFVAIDCDLERFDDELAKWLPEALYLHGRVDVEYRAEPYEEAITTLDAEAEEEKQTATVINPTGLISLKISHPGDEEHATQLQEYFDEHIRPYLEEKEVYVEAVDVVDRGVWQGREGCEIDEEGNVVRQRMLGVLGSIEYSLVEERAHEVQ